ncbi:MAG: hypothetical protein ACHQ0Y_13450 [Thermodesulfovibrionales bacterium]
MKTKKTPANTKRPGKPEYKRRESAYGDEVPICANTGCVLRKKAKCFGFEGCPGFKGR